MHIQTAKLLDQFTVQKAALLQQQPPAQPELQAFISLVQQVVDALQADNEQLFIQKTGVKQALITAALEASKL